MRINSKYWEELAAALNHYKAIDFALAERFVMEADATLGRVEKFPMIGRAMRGDYRCVPMKGFPYAIHYFLAADDEIEVVFLYHYKRDITKSWLWR